VRKDSLWAAGEKGQGWRKLLLGISPFNPGSCLQEPSLSSKVNGLAPLTLTLMGVKGRAIFQEVKNAGHSFKVCLWLGVH
jgi:hypothetical protein